MSIETKFDALYQARRKLFDEGQDIDNTNKYMLYHFADAFAKSELYAVLDDVKKNASLHSDKQIPFKLETLKKIEKQLVQRRETDKSARWQLLMMACDLADVLLGRSPRPEQKNTSHIFETLIERQAKARNND